MKKTNILYWIFTGLFGAFMLLSAIPDIMMDEIAVQGMHGELGYPVYFIPFIGVAKLLGVVAILAPGYPRIKEWAYAGFFFDLIGAAYSIIAIGKGGGDVAFMLIPLALAITSYVLYHRRMKKSAVRSAAIAPVAAPALG